MSHPIVIEPTADGLPTLYRPDLDEHYHSTKGALTNRYTYNIEMALRARDKNEIDLLEVGFGTGLNAWLTLLEAQQVGWHIRYTAFELYPLAPELAARLDYPERIDPSMASTFTRLHSCEWERPVEITPNFTLLKRHADLTCTPVEELYDVIYFDAFAPEKQPELWSEALFRHLYDHLAPAAFSPPIVPRAKSGDGCKPSASRSSGCPVRLTANGRSCEPPRRPKLPVDSLGNRHVQLVPHSYPLQQQVVIVVGLAKRGDREPHPGKLCSLLGRRQQLA